MECIFCKIAKGEIDSAKIFENQNFLAILDVNPNTRGMTLVLPKKHSDSDLFSMAEEDYRGLMAATKEVSEILKKGLKVHRVAMVMEGMGADHVHIKLYPLHGIEKEFKEILAKEQVYFEEYPGYISTQLGPKVNIEDLKKQAELIKGGHV